MRAEGGRGRGGGRGGMYRISLLGHLAAASPPPPLPSPPLRSRIPSLPPLPLPSQTNNVAFISHLPESNGESAEGEERRDRAEQNSERGMDSGMDVVALA